MSEEIENIEEAIVMTPVSSDVVYQQDSALLDRMIVTSKQYPRNEARVKKKCIDIVTMDADIAESCNYAVPRGGKKITGPSVHLAKLVASMYQNIRYGAKIVGIDATHITSEGICFDLENNVAMSATVKKSIMQNEYKWDGQKNVKTGKMVRMSEDMIVVTGNAANSIAVRNAIFSVIPKFITDPIYKASIQTMTGDVSDETKLKKRAREVVDRLMGTYNVTEEEVLFSIGKAAVDFIDKEDIVVLIGIGTAIKEGDTTIDQAFRPKKAETVKPEHAGDTNDRAKQLIESATTVKELESRLKTMPKKMKEDLKELIATKSDSLEQAELAEKERLQKEQDEKAAGEQSA